MQPLKISMVAIRLNKTEVEFFCRIRQDSSGQGLLDNDVAGINNSLKLERIEVSAK